MARFRERVEKTDKKANYEKYTYDTSQEISCAMYSYSKSAITPVCYYNQKRRHVSKKFEIHQRKLDYCTMFVFVEGNFGFIFDNIAFHPSPGDIFIIKNNTEFSSFFSENTYIDCYEITFPMDFFEHFNENSIFHKLFFNDMENGAKIISPNSIISKTILQKFNELDNIINSEIEYIDIISFSYIVQIVGIIYSQEKNNLENIHIEKIPKKLKTAVNYIHENFTEPITISDISNYCGISSTYLARMFKNIYLNTPLEYITRLRITYAKRLLVNGMSISDACFNSGFNDYNHFIAKFKAVTGTTPFKYKKNKS